MATVTLPAVAPSRSVRLLLAAQVRSGLHHNLDRYVGGSFASSSKRPATSAVGGYLDHLWHGSHATDLPSDPARRRR
jgi:hypothetical protein